MNPISAFSGVVRLTDWGVMRAQGSDAASFLHGQLTQDISGLAEGQGRLAGYCSPKGRLLATLVVSRRDGDVIDLACSAELLAPTLKRLSMFVMRAKCKLSDVSAELTLWGLAGTEATAWLGESAPAAVWGVTQSAQHQVTRLPDALGQPRYLLAQEASDPAPGLPALSPEAWAWLEVHSGVVRVVQATAEQFVPQMVNLELVGGVNFQKGCYPGQEVVARSQYRGTLKRRAMVFECAAAASPAQEVFHSDDPGQPAGQVVLVACHPVDPQRHAALVEIKLAALTAGSVHLGLADGPLMVAGQLPYALPTDAG